MTIRFETVCGLVLAVAFLSGCGRTIILTPRSLSADAQSVTVGGVIDRSGLVPVEGALGRAASQATVAGKLTVKTLDGKISAEVPVGQDSFQLKNLKSGAIHLLVVTQTTGGRETPVGFALIDLPESVTSGSVRIDGASSLEGLVALTIAQEVAGGVADLLKTTNVIQNLDRSDVATISQGLAPSGMLNDLADATSGSVPGSTLALIRGEARTGAARHVARIPFLEMETALESSDDSGLVGLETLACSPSTCGGTAYAYVLSGSSKTIDARKDGWKTFRSNFEILSFKQQLDFPEEWPSVGFPLVLENRTRGLRVQKKKDGQIFTCLQQLTLTLFRAADRWRLQSEQAQMDLECKPENDPDAGVLDVSLVSPVAAMGQAVKALPGHPLELLFRFSIPVDSGEWREAVNLPQALSASVSTAVGREGFEGLVRIQGLPKGTSGTVNVAALKSAMGGGLSLPLNIAYQALWADPARLHLEISLPPPGVLRRGGILPARLMEGESAGAVPVASTAPVQWLLNAQPALNPLVAAQSGRATVSAILDGRTYSASVEVYERQFGTGSGGDKVLRGKVADVSGNAIEGALIQIPSLGLSTASNPNGLYAFTGLPPGTYSVVVDRDGVTDQTQVVTIP